MATNKNSEGATMDFLASSAISSGDLVVMNGIVGVAIEDIASGSTGPLALEGEFTVPHSVSTTSSAAQGDYAYALTSGGKATGSSTSSGQIGVFTAIVAQADTTAKVKINAGKGQG